MLSSFGILPPTIVAKAPKVLKIPLVTAVSGGVESGAHSFEILMASVFEIAPTKRATTRFLIYIYILLLFNKNNYYKLHFVGVFYSLWVFCIVFKGFV